MEHKKLEIKYDKNLIEKILDDIDMRYIVLFLYIIRNDLLRDLSEDDIIEAYERVLILDDIYKNNVTNIWEEELIEVAIDLGLFKNIRSFREFQQKDDDFIIKMGEETVTIEQGTILVPVDTLFTMINKKFKLINKRNFNLALTRLKAVRCESTGVIHPFIYQLGDNDYTLADDLYYLLDQFGNIYQSIKMEITIEGFYERFKDNIDDLTDYIDQFDSTLNSKKALNNINKAIEENKDIIQSLKEAKVKLSEKFDNEEIDKNAEIYKNWNSTLLTLINLRHQVESIDNKLLEIKNYYSGKGKRYSYLTFIEKVSFNEDDIVDEIQDSLIKLREEIIEINEEVSQFSKKEIKLLNLDYERFLIMSEDD